MSARRRNLFGIKRERVNRSAPSIGVPRRFKPKTIWIVGVCLLLAVTLILLISLPGQRDGAAAPEGAVSSFFSPIQSFFSGIFDAVGGFFGRFGDAERLQGEVDTLMEDNRKLREENIALTEMSKENERLNALLGYAQEWRDYEPVMARVIGKNSGNWFSYLALDCGTNQGVEVDMVVATAQGLVGRVVEVGSNWCKVLTIIDGRSAVGALIQRTRDHGVVHGNLTLSGQGPLTRMLHLPDDSEVLPGDQVLTSGLGGVFPKGMVIGEVVEVATDSAQPQKFASIKPSVDFAHLENVLIFKIVIPPVALE